MHPFLYLRNFSILSTKLLKSGNKRSENLKKNIAGSLVVKGFNIIIQFLLVPITLHYLDANVYGIWLTLSSIVLWIGFFDVGFTLGLKNKLAEAIAKGDFIKGKKLVSTTYITLSVIFIPLCIILEFIVPHVDWSSFLNVPQIYNHQITLVMHILILCVSIQMVANTIGAVVAAFQKVAISNSFTVIGNFISLIIVYILTKTTTPSMLYLSLTVSLAPVFVMIVASLFLYNRNLRTIRPSMRCFDKTFIREILSLGIKFFIINIQVVVMYQSTNILISNISSSLDVTSYNIAYKYITSAMMILANIMSPFWPAFTEAYTKQDFKWMNNIFRKLSKLYSLICISIIVMVLVSPFVYSIWIGDSKLVPWKMTISIGIYSIVESWFYIIAYLINGIGTVKLQSIISPVGMLVHIPLSLFLGQYIGAIGVVASMTMLALIYNLVFTIQLQKILKGKATDIWLK